MPEKFKKCIRWTKKSGKGNSEWMKAYRRMEKKERLMPTPVKTIFVSVLVMVSMMVNYRDVVENCFSNQPQLKLRQRIPSPEIWEIAGIVVIALEPIMKSCILNQRKYNWLLSDSIADIANLYIKYSQILEDLSLLSEHNLMASFEGQLKLFKKNICYVIREELEPLVCPLLTFCPLYGNGFLHHILALTLDPEFKKVKNSFMRLHVNDSDARRSLARKYDNDIATPLLVKINKKRTGGARQSAALTGTTSVGNNSNENSTQSTTSNNDSSGRAQINDGDTDEGGEHCCITEHGDTPEKGLKRQVETQLTAFRQERFNKNTEDKLAWLRKRRTQYPDVTMLAQHIIAIPATQIDNERIFSLTGRITLPLRNKIETDRIDNLVCIARNYPFKAHNEGIVHSGVISMEEFSHHLIGLEKDANEDLDDSDSQLQGEHTALNGNQ